MSVGMECCEDTERVPDAVAEPSPVADLCDERRRHSGERVGHQHFAAGLKDQNVRVVHTAEGGTDVVHGDSELARERGHGRRIPCAHDLFVNTEAKGGIIDHGGSVIRHWNGSQGFATRLKALAEIHVRNRVSHFARPCQQQTRNAAPAEPEAALEGRAWRAGYFAMR